MKLLLPATLLLYGFAAGFSAAIASTLPATSETLIAGTETEEIQRLLTEQNQAAIDPANLRSMQDSLRQLEQKAVLLYPIVLNDRLELILVTADAPPIRRTVPISRQELNRAIAAFRQALQNPNSDAATPAQQLYQWLIAPIEDDLSQAEAEAIVYAPDRQLRDIPLAALHDGEGWLVERFSVNNITAASLIDFDRSRPQQPNVLAAAASEGTTDLRVGDRDYNFSPIPYAQTEVEAIAALMPNTTVLLDQDFTLQALTTQMNDYDIVHLATNGVFIPGQPEESFFLLGNSEVVTLRDISNWNLSNVDLIVLSGCDTALSGELGSGEEILGFGYQMQQAGAKAVLSSLWTVSDRATSLLMEAFYRNLSQGNQYAIALRQAQLALIQDNLVSLQPKGLGSIRARPALDRTSNDSHPYYWAAFVLIGNGL